MSPYIWPQVKPRAGEAPRLPVHQIHIEPTDLPFVPQTHADLHALICHAERLATARGLADVAGALMDALLALEEPPAPRRDLLGFDVATALGALTIRPTDGGMA